MSKRTSTMMYQISLQVQTQILRVMTPNWQDKVKQAQTGLFSKHKIHGGLLDLNCQATPVVISAGQYDKIAPEHSFFVSILHYLLQIQLLNDNVIPIL